MKYENYFKDMFKSIPDYRKRLLLIFSIKNDAGLLKGCGFLKNDINQIILEFKNILMEENEEYFHYIKNEK